MALEAMPPSMVSSAALSASRQGSSVAAAVHRHCFPTQSHISMGRRHFISFLVWPHSTCCASQVMLSVNPAQLAGDADDSDLPALLSASQPVFSSSQVSKSGLPVLLCMIHLPVAAR